MICTRCEGTGFLNLHQVDEATLHRFDALGHQVILDWIRANVRHDVCICDCCGDTTDWYGLPGKHNFGDEPFPECY